MAEFSPTGARLHALIGDAVLDLPFHLVERLEHALADGVTPEMTPALIGHLRLMERGDAGDGMPWDEPGLPDGRSGELARVSRNLTALSALWRLLQAAYMARRHGGAGQGLGEDMEQALILAGRELADSAGVALHSRR
ncbi:hypothetical protein [Stenotrophomonas tumulicola]|uniref:Uncharacterized protein n=1 Tax=Stenotrophomonas tumulicola TaxID=1685415 RepID=A0A7W3FKN8_9GAMM|nr:hypothetical protein [Stenotrophomonas tumulicola]MBA8681339.1 hypothetical protein [Stenotrophomonas tumulicola]